MATFMRGVNVNGKYLKQLAIYIYVYFNLKWENFCHKILPWQGGFD